MQQPGLPLLSQAQEALHPMHSVIVDCLMPLVNCCRATDDTAEAIKHLQQLLAALEVILGCHTVEVMILRLSESLGLAGRQADLMCHSHVTHGSSGL